MSNGVITIMSFHCFPRRGEGYKTIPFNNLGFIRSRRSFFSMMAEEGWDFRVYIIVDCMSLKA